MTPGSGEPTVPARPFRPEPKRDRYERYLLPDPVSGKEKSWTRATTFAKAVADMFGLHKWEKRMVAKGIALREDLYALAASTSIEDKKAFDKICDDAKEYAKASSGANLGKALHAFTEQLDAGFKPDVPRPWDADIAAYEATLTKESIKPQPHWIERVVLFPEYRIAGTLDRVVYKTDWERPRIADVKTGRDLSYSWGEIAIQLAIYANATRAWDPIAEKYEPMPDVDQQWALVMHLPVGQARCELWDVNIAAGLEAIQLCADVRGWRSRKDLAVPHVAGFPDASLVLSDRIDRALNREAIEALWTVHRGEWTQHHTLAAQQRLAVLQAPAGTTGGTPEKEQEKEKETAA